MKLVILAVLFSCLFVCFASFSSDSSNQLSPNQKCMTSEKFQFYCSSDGQCHDGNSRCTPNGFLSWLSRWLKLRCPEENNECYEVSNDDGYYDIYLYYKPLLTKDRLSPLEHYVVQYRGFVYEFGNYKPNTLRILDILDPKYIYRDISKNQYHHSGKSNCTSVQVNQHVIFWRQNYNLYNFCSNNCQIYAASLVK